MHHCCLIENRTLINMKERCNRLKQDIVRYCYHSPLVCIVCCVLHIIVFPIIKFYELVYYIFGLTIIPNARVRYLVGSIIMGCIIGLCILFSRLCYTIFWNESINLMFIGRVDIFFFKVFLGFMCFICTVFTMIIVMCFCINCCCVEYEDE